MSGHDEAPFVFNDRHSTKKTGKPLLACAFFALKLLASCHARRLSAHWLRARRLALGR